MTGTARLSPPVGSSLASKIGRLDSVDAYRGLVMVLMLAEVLRLPQVGKQFSESTVWQWIVFHASHVDWSGCSLHDLIQPSFSFLVGVVLPYSIAGRLARGQSKLHLTLHAAWRACLLVALGIFLRSIGKPQTNFTFEDTLSQIGLGYLPLFVLAFFRVRWQWLALVLILIGCWLAFAYYPLPEEGFRYKSVGVARNWPHHFEGFAAHWNKNSNLAWAFDRWFLNLFPRRRPFTYHHGGYATLSFVPTLATMILGLLAGGWLHAGSSQRAKLGRLALAGAACLSLGLVADQTGVCPSVKRIWTPSWVFVSGGWCFLFLAAFYYVVDLKGFKAWTFPLRVVGANSILAYVMAHPFEGFVVSALHTHLGRDVFVSYGKSLEPLLTGICVLAIYWLILFALYKKRVFIRI